ncbi:MAG: PA0069 family radical SAM protein [Rhodobacterales bacterium]|nr:PA0069 family radical SAM protein [Rhodobacterales bacterium]
MERKGILPGQVPRGRGAASNAAGRYERLSHEAAFDGWDIPHADRTLRTEVRAETPRSALAWNGSPDLPFDRSVNPWRGCEHGCIYCYARPSHAWLNLSPGLDFETRLIARPGIDRVLAQELARPGYQVAPIALGTNTDPWQPAEGAAGITRAVLRVLADHNHPLAITTRGTLIERDIDLLAPMAERGLVRVGISLTTLDADLARRMEPRAPAPARRLAIVRRLTDAGIPVRAMVSPVIPALTDHETEAILTAARDAGAVAASQIVLRLPREVADLFRDWVQANVPDRAARILARVRELHGGQDYDPAFGRRMTGQGVWADLQAQRFRLACARLGLAIRLPPLRCDLFAVPPKPGDQLSLF